jgi:methyl-accepting chemotaxis protein
MSLLHFLSSWSRGTGQIARAADVMRALDASMARIEFDAEGTIVTANDRFLDLVGYSLDDVRGRSHSMFVDEATRSGVAYREFWDRLRAGEFQSGEFHRLGRGGRPIWIQATYSPVPGEKAVDAVARTERGIAAIASSTEHQAANAQEVKLAIRSLSQTTESTAASAEEMAASAEELNAQAQGLRDLVRQFHV